MNYWVMAFPCLLYSASVGTSNPPPPRGLTVMLVANFAGTVTGIMHTYYSSVPALDVPTRVTKLVTAYYSICFSLNILLTLMIITRLILHRRNIQRAIGTSDGSTRLYTTIIIMLVESYALYAIALLSYTVSFTLEASVYTIFSGFLGEIQVRATRPCPDTS